MSRWPDIASSELRNLSYKLTINEITYRNDLDDFKLSIKVDAELLPDERDRLANIYKTKFNELSDDGDKLTPAQAQKHLALDTTSIVEDEPEKESSKLHSLLNEIENKGFLFRDKYGRAYADVTIPDGTVQTLELDTKNSAMSDHIRSIADRRLGIIVNPHTGDDYADTLRLRAERSGNEAEVFGRFGRSEDGATQYEFLHDGTGTVIEVSAQGVRALRKTDATGRSVLPKGAEPGVPHKLVERTEIKQLCIQLMQLMRVPKRYWSHALAWLISSRHYGTEYPIIYILAVSGAGKSTMGEFLERMVDPKAVRQLKVSKKLDGLQSAMAANHVTAQHNISKRYPTDLQDLMCVASDGERDSKRKAYSTNEVAVLPVGGPLVLTTRYTGMANAEDVANRTWTIELERIEKGVKRMNKDELCKMIDDNCIEFTPVLRALHSEVLRLLPDMPDSEADHLAHSRRVGEAVCQILELPETFDEFLKAEKVANLQYRIDENSFVTSLIEYVVRRGGQVESGFADLLRRLRLDEDQSDADARRESRFAIDKENPSWPADAKEAKDILAKNGDLLQIAGLEIPAKIEGRSRTKNGVVYLFKTNANAPSMATLSYKLTLVTNPDLPEGPTRSSVVKANSIDTITKIDSSNEGVFSPLYNQLVETHGNDWQRHAPPSMIVEYNSF